MKKLLPYIIIIIAFFIIGILLANFLIMPSLVHMGEEVTVPNVSNLTLDEAIAELKKSGLQGVVIERRFDPIIEEGKIIIQEPLPDALVKKGRIVNLSVSLGLETVQVPYLVGVDLERASLIIDRIGLLIGSIDSVFSDSVARGRIIKTSPNPGVTVKKGNVISLTMSLGQGLKMPNVIGMKLLEAEDLLKKLGLFIGEVKEVEASGKHGIVVIQNPQSDEAVSAGDSVRLMVTE